MGPLTGVRRTAVGWQFPLGLASPGPADPRVEASHPRRTFGLASRSGLLAIQGPRNSGRRLRRVGGLASLDPRPGSNLVLVGGPTVDTRRGGTRFQVVTACRQARSPSPNSVWSDSAVVLSPRRWPTFDDRRCYGRVQLFEQFDDPVTPVLAWIVRLLSASRRGGPGREGRSPPRSRRLEPVSSLRMPLRLDYESRMGHIRSGPVTQPKRSGLTDLRPIAVAHFNAIFGRRRVILARPLPCLRNEWVNLNRSSHPASTVGARGRLNHQLRGTRSSVARPRSWQIANRASPTRLAGARPKLGTFRIVVDRFWPWLACWWWAGLIIESGPCAQVEAGRRSRSATNCSPDLALPTGRAMTTRCWYRKSPGRGRKLRTSWERSTSRRIVRVERGDPPGPRSSYGRARI